MDASEDPVKEESGEGIRMTSSSLEKCSASVANDTGGRGALYGTIDVSDEETGTSSEAQISLGGLFNSGGGEESGNSTVGVCGVVGVVISAGSGEVEPAVFVRWEVADSTLLCLILWIVLASFSNSVPVTD